MYIKLNNGAPENYTIGQLRKDNPNTSFPRHIPEDMLAEYGVYPVSAQTQPTYDSRTQRCYLSETAVSVEGAWVYQWIIEDRTAEEIQKSDQALGEGIRSTRDALLSDSDWTQVADSPVDKAAWATYRQALRDIPAQSGFPQTVNWPTSP